MKIGITGHQDIGSSADVAWVIEQLRALIDQSTLSAGITSLAVGSDQLYATLLTEHQKPFTALIPCRYYERTFATAQNLAHYQSLLKQAAEVVYLPFDDPSEEAFWAAGKQMADNADSVIAIWNGLPAKGLGGTGDVVRYCRETGKKVLHINPRTHQAVEIS